MNVKELRKKLKLTQAEFAGKMKVSEGTVSRWERGDQKPRPRHIRIMERLWKKL